MRNFGTVASKYNQLQTVQNIDSSIAASVCLEALNDSSTVISLIDSNYISARVSSVPFTNVGSRPTTIAGYGITDLYTSTVSGSLFDSAETALIDSSVTGMTTLKGLADAIDNLTDVDSDLRKVFA